MLELRIEFFLLKIRDNSPFDCRWLADYWLGNFFVINDEFQEIYWVNEVALVWKLQINQIFNKSIKKKNCSKIKEKKFKAKMMWKNDKINLAWK